MIDAAVAFCFVPKDMRHHPSSTRVSVVACRVPCVM